MAAVIGALLAASGTTLQALLRNPLADPYLLGVSGGAAVGAVAGLIMGVAFPAPLAMTGAAISLAVVLFAAREDKTVNITRMVLAGAAVHSLSSAGLTLLLMRMSGRPDAGGLYFWLLGGLTPLPWNTLITLSLMAAVALTALFALSPALNLLTLGPESATALGLPANRVAWTALLFAAMATGLAVTFNGMIPFVGLLVPHAARAWAGADHRRSLPASAALGALLVVAADALARWICAPREIPTGVVTALAGAPFFLVLLYRRRILS